MNGFVIIRWVEVEEMEFRWAHLPVIRHHTGCLGFGALLLVALLLVLYALASFALGQVAPRYPAVNLLCLSFFEAWKRLSRGVDSLVEAQRRCRPICAVAVATLCLPRGPTSFSKHWRRLKTPVHHHGPHQQVYSVHGQ